MKDLIIAYGQHRNEKSAEYLAPLVAEDLIRKGYEIELIENPDKRTLLDFIFESASKGNKLSWDDVTKFLNGWEDNSLIEQYPDKKPPVISFHNQGSYKENMVREEDDSIHFPPFAFHRTRGLYIIEILAIRKPIKDTLTDQELSLVKETLDERTYDRRRRYLESTWIDETRKYGLLGPKMVKTLADAIESFLIKRNPTSVLDHDSFDKQLRKKG